MTSLVLLHGGCHGSWCFDFLRPELEECGIPSVAVDLPYDDPGVGLEDLGSGLRSAIDTIDDDDVIVVAHSMGGMVAPLAAGHPSVRHIVLLCAVLAPVLVGAGTFGTVPAEALDVDGEGRTKLRSSAALRDYLYQDCPDEIVAWAWERLTPLALRIATDPYPVGAWPSIPTTSIICRDDRAVSGAMSRAAAQTIGARTIEIDGSHSPFASRPGELAAALLDIVR